MYGWIDLSYLYCGANAGVGVDVVCSLLFSIKIIVCHVPDAGKQKPKKLVFTVRSRSHINIITILLYQPSLSISLSKSSTIHSRLERRMDRWNE